MIECDIERDHTVGLTIPDFIKAELTPATIKRLKEHGHGISFNSKNSAQMRYSLDSIDYGGSYPRNAYSCWEKLLLSAMATYNRLSATMPNGQRYAQANKGVYFATRMKAGSDNAEYSYNVSYKEDGKPKIRSFYCGTENSMSTERKRHTELTAWHFRAQYCEANDPAKISLAAIKGWRNKRYYEGK